MAALEELVVRRKTRLAGATERLAVNNRLAAERVEHQGVGVASGRRGHRTSDGGAQGAVRRG
jgi:hypothetical protein